MLEKKLTTVEVEILKSLRSEYDSMIRDLGENRIQIFMLNNHTKELENKLKENFEKSNKIAQDLQSKYGETIIEINLDEEKVIIQE
jgi:hypothetical protein